jgi:hypothetical protein
MAIKKQQTTLKASVTEDPKKKTAATSKKSAVQKSSGTVDKSEPAKKIRARSTGTPEKTSEKKNTASTGKRRKTSVKTPAASGRATKKNMPEKSPDGLKIFLPQEEYFSEPLKTSFPELPEEYGENELILMEVDPSVIFVSWEVKPDEVARKTGRLNLRVYDVTGADVNSSGRHSKTGSFFDIPVRNRVDSRFYELKMSGKEVIMEIGLLRGKKKFKPIIRSNRVSIPELHEFEEPGIKRSEEDKLFGY